VARTTLLEEVAKFRAARRIWASIMRDEFGAKNPKSQMLRFHTQTAGVQLTAQQPEVNMVRVTIQALSAVLGGTQSLHTNSYDEAIALPTEKAARLALRTQQVIAHESDLTATVDPFAGSYAIEAMTTDIETAVLDLIASVEDLGGSVAAIEKGFQKAEIERSAYQVAREIDAGDRVVVGVNRFKVAEKEPYEPMRVDPAIEAAQASRLAELRAARDDDQVRRCLDDLRRLAENRSVSAEPGEVSGDNDGNLLYPLKSALRARATVGEVCNALRDVWGVYIPADAY
jgi:methylmalonyl-CoA mutase N-terminal domain/subunit